MTDNSDEPSPPDVTYTSEGLSRRDLIAAGATATVSGMAGCADVARDVGLQEEEVWGSEEHNRTRTHAEVIEGYELGIKDVTLESVRFSLRQNLNPNQQPETPLEGTLRVYWTALHGGSEVVLAEEEASLRGVSRDHELSIDFGEDVINIPQELEVRFESPQLDDDEVTLGTDDIAYLPFDNEARDERTVRALGPKFASEDKWNDPSDQLQKVELWYNDLDEPPFNVPALDRSQYAEQNVDGEDWYELHNIELTAIIRIPILNKKFPTRDGEVQGPYYDWTVVTLRMSELEYLESLYWNSPATMKLTNRTNPWSVGDGGFRQREVSHKTNYGSTVSVERLDEGEAQESQTAFISLVQGVFHERVNVSDQNPNDLIGANPIKFGVGRSVCRRWAQKLSDAVENKPYSDVLEPLDYTKMTTLKALVGEGLTYKWSLGPYHQTPEESIVAMYKTGTQGATASDGADCVSASVLFAGIGYWLTDTDPVMPIVQVSAGVKHVFSGWGGLEIPAFDHLETPKALGYGSRESDPKTSPEIDYGYWNIECTEAFPSIGFHRSSLPDSQPLLAWSNGSDLNLQTHIPLNDDYEPDIDGEIKAPPSNVYTFYHDPFQANHLYYFEEQ